MFKIASDILESMHTVKIWGRSLFCWTSVVLLYVLILLIGVLPLKFEVVNRYFDNQFTTNNLDPIDIFLYLMASVLFWHALFIKVWWPINISRSKLRLLFIKSLDYIWLSIAALSIIIGGFDVSRDEAARKLADAKTEIAKRDVYIEKMGINPLDFICGSLKSKESSENFVFYKDVCDHPEQIKRRVFSLPDACSALLTRESLLRPSVDNIDILTNGDAFSKIRYICLVFAEKQFYNHLLDYYTSIIISIPEKSANKNNFWITLILYALALRLVKTSAEVVEVWRKA